MISYDKILVCGSGPSLPIQLKGIDLSDYFVVRVNTWHDIPGYDNKCDAWAFYPFLDIDFNKYLSKAKCIWMPHFGMEKDCERATGVMPEYTISSDQTRDFHRLIRNLHPTSGAVVVYMATLICKKVFIAGFDFYGGELEYYWSDSKPSIRTIEHHAPMCEKKWIEGNKNIFNLGANQ